MAGEHLTEQLEFGAQVLGLRFLVDDRNASEFVVRSLRPQLVPEHIDEHLFHVFDSVRPGEEVTDFAATGLLGGGDVLQQKCAACVRIDLDQPRTVRRQVKVVTEEHTV